MEHYADLRRDDWPRGDLRMPTSALLPMGGAVSGVAGPNWALIGDAAGCVNPLNGEGIDYGLETGRLGRRADRDDATSTTPGRRCSRATTARRSPSRADWPASSPFRAARRARPGRHAVATADDDRPARHGQLHHRRRPRPLGAGLALGRPPRVRIDAHPSADNSESGARSPSRARSSQLGARLGVVN